MSARPFCQIVSYVGRRAAGLRETGFRQISLSSPVHRPGPRPRTDPDQTQTRPRTDLDQTQTRPGTDPDQPASPWRLMGAVCLQRLPVISQDRSPIEEQFAQLLHQMELERSLLSDHELRLLEDAERMSRKQAGEYDSDEEYSTDDIITAQDLEDAWEHKLKLFPLAPRAGEDGELGSVQRCLGDSLVLLAQQRWAEGGERLWLLPQAPWEPGETLRGTAERALASLPEADFKATFLGNAPCGVYKSRLPRALRTDGRLGTKVFFFKAILEHGSAPLDPAGQRFLWVRKSELQDYLRPEYLEKVRRFILDL